MEKRLIDLNPITIYIVDDYLLTRIAYKKYFENDEEFKVCAHFKSAKECLLELEKNPVDIILSDLELGDINGIEFTKLVSENFYSTKVIIVTSYKSPEAILATLASGASGYVLKNNFNKELKNIIKMVMRGEFHLDLEMARLAFSILPNPNIKDLDNLYENKKLKDSLTQRELEVLKLLIEGKTNQEIADTIIISTNTAKAHVGSILTKLNVQDRVQAAVKAVKANLF